MAKTGTGSDGRVVFQVEVDDSKVKSGLDRVKQTISDNSQSWGDSLEKFVGKQMDSLIAKVAKLGAAFGEFVVKFIAEGIDLAQNFCGEATKKISQYLFFLHGVSFLIS